MKRLVTIVALMSAFMFQANAQVSVEQALKDAEEQAKLADKNPKDGKQQYNAAVRFYSDALGDKKDLDRALTYANRALEIAKAQPVPADTLMGLTCYAIGSIYLQMQDYEKAQDYMFKALDGFEQELGRYDPVTNGTKLVVASMMIGLQPLRAFPRIMDAFVDNSIAPEDKRIQNMYEANIAEEFALEFIIAEYTDRYRYALPLITYEGKRYLVVETNEWSMEKPLVGWMVPSLVETDIAAEKSENDRLVLCDDNNHFKVLTGEERHKVNLIFNFKHYVGNPRQLECNPEDARIMFFQPNDYNEILTAYREFKKK